MRTLGKNSDNIWKIKYLTDDRPLFVAIQETRIKMKEVKNYKIFEAEARVDRRGAKKVNAVTLVDREVFSKIIGVGVDYIVVIVRANETEIIMVNMYCWHKLNIE